VFITRQDIAKDPSIGPKIKNWAGSLNLASKKEGCPTFKLTGPCSLKVRPRITSQRVSAAQTQHFMGGEEFRITGVVLEKDMHRDGIAIHMMFGPASLKLASDIASMAMPLQEAIGVFDDLESWVDLSVVEKTEARSTTEIDKKAVAELPSVEETRASETWGAW
jgi:hypothetical protein